MQKFASSDIPCLRHSTEGSPGTEEAFSQRAMEALRMLVVPLELQRETFASASKKWLEYKTITTPSGRARFVSARSLGDLEQYINALNRVFRNLILASIHAGHIREYQMMRASGKLHPEGKPEREISPNKINQEVGTLIRILKFAHCWTPTLEETYLPLQREESDIPRALSPLEQHMWLMTAGSRPQWEFVYWYSLLGLDCPMSTNEQRGLRIGDLDLHNNVLMVRVRSSKNKYRTRTIPLSDAARWAVDRLMERAKDAGAEAPQQYLMPFRKRYSWVPEKSMTVGGIKRHWNEVRKAAGLTWFVPYGLRHTSCTRYAEAGTPIAVIMGLAGHMTRKMSEHYTHISEQAKRKAVQNAGTKYVAQRAAI